MATQTTIKDVARESGVSIGTVDRVLHNRGKVSLEKQKAVLDAVKKLDYKPSQVARALVSRKNNIKIGITYPNVDNDFWSEIVYGIEQAEIALEPFGVELIVEQTHSYDPVEQIAVIDKLVAQGVNGILLTAVENSSPERIERHIPSELTYGTVVNFTYGERRAFHIGPDDYSLGALAARLISFYQGKNAHTLIISPNYNFNGTQQRIAGFVSKTRENFPDMTILSTVPVPGTTEKELYENVYNYTTSLIEKYPSATSIYVTNGLFEWVAAAVRDSSRASEITVVGHEYTPSLKNYLESGIVGATIYQHPAQQWYSAINKLYEILVSDDKPEYQDYVVECSILMEETLSFAKIGKLDLK